MRLIDAYKDPNHPYYGKGPIITNTKFTKGSTPDKVSHETFITWDNQGNVCDPIKFIYDNGTVPAVHPRIVSFPVDMMDGSTKTCDYLITEGVWERIDNVANHTVQFIVRNFKLIQWGV